MKIVCNDCGEILTVEGTTAKCPICHWGLDIVIEFNRMVDVINIMHRKIREHAVHCMNGKMECFFCQTTVGGVGNKHKGWCETKRNMDSFRKIEGMVE